MSRCRAIDALAAEMHCAAERDVAYSTSVSHNSVVPHPQLDRSQLCRPPAASPECHSGTTMTALLPPNLLKLFAPRPQPPFLKPLTKDQANRGPNKLGGINTVVRQAREDAEDAQVKEGLTDRPATKSEGPSVANAEKDKVVDGRTNGHEEPMEVDPSIEEGEMSTSASAARAAVNGKGREKPAAKTKKRDKFSELGVVGQEAIKLRREARKKRQEEYKKMLEANCSCLSLALEAI